MRTGLVRVLPAVLLLAAACSSVPARDYATASDLFTANVNALSTLREAGKIDDHSYRQITPVIHAANAAFETWREAIEAAEPGQQIDVPKAVVNAVLDAIDQLVIWKAKLGGK